MRSTNVTVESEGEGWRNERRVRNEGRGGRGKATSVVYLYAS